jgi:hypothetical protein
MTFSDRLRWLNAFLRGRNLPAPTLRPPFFSAQEVGAVHRFFEGCDPATDPDLQADGPLPGFCFVCQAEVKFEVLRPADGGEVNWRETLRCPQCGLINRWRGCLHLFDAICTPREDDRIYLTETLSPLCQNLAGRFPNLVSSEYLPDAEPGETVMVGEQPVRVEDVTCLTFPERSFDCVLTFDVLEHVPDYRAALVEFHRVLRRGGRLLLTAPFNFRQETSTRARIDEAGEVTHLMEPCYHGDPLSPEGILAFYDFGMDLLEDLHRAGFRQSYLVCYRSNELGYAAANVAFVARR